MKIIHKIIIIIEAFFISIFGEPEINFSRCSRDRLMRYMKELGSIDAYIHDYTEQYYGHAITHQIQVNDHPFILKIAGVNTSFDQVAFASPRIKKGDIILMKMLNEDHIGKFILLDCEHIDEHKEKFKAHICGIGYQDPDDIPEGDHFKVKEIINQVYDPEAKKEES
jgi:hypothetical protein